MTSFEDSLGEFGFHLPESLIAQQPALRRSDSRLLHWMADGQFAHRGFTEISSLIREGDLLVLNDTRVIPARLFGRKVGGTAQVEVLLLVELQVERGEVWEVLLRPARRLPEGSRIGLEEGVEAIVGSDRGQGRRQLHFPEGLDVRAFARRHGHMPLPPYIRREDGAEDRERYQTVFARTEGSVAAPTAGLHFDESILRSIQDAGAALCHITLHVGIGTFRPVDRNDWERGKLHGESMHVSAAAIKAMVEQKRKGGRIIAVGTTACRALESLEPSQVEDYRGQTHLFIRPGYDFRWVDVLLTNFHLPGSSLLMLVAAFAGERWKRAYELAVDEGYRFYSYGDANWIERA